MLQLLAFSANIQAWTTAHASFSGLPLLWIFLVKHITDSRTMTDSWPCRSSKDSWESWLCHRWFTSDTEKHQRDCGKYGASRLYCCRETIQVLILSLWLQRLFDVSKQVVGQMFVHGVNVFVSHLGSSTTESNACVFYFLNILIDTTLGKFLLSISDQHDVFIMVHRRCFDLCYPPPSHIYR